MNLGAWSAWRVLALGAAWLALVALAIAAGLAVKLWRARDQGAATGGRPALISSDVAVAITPPQLWLATALLLLPPLVLTIVWVWQRFGST